MNRFRSKHYATTADLNRLGESSQDPRRLGVTPDFMRQPSRRRLLVAQVTAGLRARGGPQPTVSDFLNVLATVDNQAADRIRAAVGSLGLASFDASAVERMRIRVDKQAVRLANDVLVALQMFPEAEQSGVTAEELAGDKGRSVALRDLRKTAAWVKERIVTGKRIIETWQADAQAEILSMYLLALAQAPTEKEWLALIRDGAEVIDLEMERLTSTINRRVANHNGRADLAAQLGEQQQEILFRQTMQDLRDKKQVPRAVLEEMAQYYETRILGGDDPLADLPPEPPARGGKGAKAKGHKPARPAKPGKLAKPAKPAKPAAKSRSKGQQG